MKATAVFSCTTSLLAVCVGVQAGIIEKWKGMTDDALELVYDYQEDLAQMQATCYRPPQNYFFPSSPPSQLDSVVCDEGSCFPVPYETFLSVYLEPEQTELEEFGATVNAILSDTAISTVDISILQVTP